MSLIQDLDDLTRSVRAMQEKSAMQQRMFFRLVDGLVRINQEFRVAKRYDVSDRLRALLAEAGVDVIQGTGGMSWDDIKRKYHDKGIPQPMGNDTFRLKSIANGFAEADNWRRTGFHR
jgi:hypothetical protein